MVVVGIAVIAACGGDDDAQTPAVEATAAPDSDDVAAGDESGVQDDSGSVEMSGDDASDMITDALGEGDDGETFDDALATVSPETRYGIAAGQLDPEPSVEVDGTEIRLVFDGGTVANAFIDCIIATVTAAEGETVTLVYPDGDEVC